MTSKEQFAAATSAFRNPTRQAGRQTVQDQPEPVVYGPFTPQQQKENIAKASNKVAVQKIAAQKSADPFARRNAFAEQAAKFQAEIDDAKRYAILLKNEPAPAPVVEEKKDEPKKSLKQKLKDYVAPAAVIESGKQALGELGDVASRGADRAKALASAAKDYVTRPGQIDPNRDVVAGAELAQETAKAVAQTTFDLGKTLVKGFTSMTEARTKDTPVVKSVVKNSADFINTTIESIGQELHDSYNTFNQAQPGKADFLLAIAKPGVDIALAESPAAMLPQLALEATKDVPVLDIPSRLFTSIMGKATQAITWGSRQALEYAPITDAQKDTLATTLGNLGTAVIMVKGVKVGSDAYGKYTERVGARLQEAQAAKMEQAKNFAPEGTDLTTSPLAKLTDQEVKNEMYQAAKETPEIAVPAVGEVAGIRVATNQKTMLENYIKGNEALDYKIVPKFGDSKVKARFEWDFEKKRGTIYATDKTSAVSLAHELGHYFDRTLSHDVSKPITDILGVDYLANKADIDASFSSYIVKKLGGEATAEQIAQGVRDLTENFQKEILALSKNKRGNIRENFADAVKEVITKYEASKAKAPNFTDFIASNLREKGLITDQIMVAAGETAQFKDAVPEVGPVKVEEASAPTKEPRPAEQGQADSKFSTTGLDTGARVEGRPAYNPEKFNTPDEVRTAILGDAAKADEFSDSRIKKTNEQIKELAQQVDLTADDLINLKPGSAANAETLTRAREILNVEAQRTLDITKQSAADPSNVRLRENLVMQVLKERAVAASVAGLRTEASNALRSLSIKAGMLLNDEVTVRTLMEKAGLTEEVAISLQNEILRAHSVLGESPAAFHKAVGEIVVPTKMTKIFDYWYSAILSGPGTLAFNAGTNLIKSLGELTVVLTQDPKNAGAYISTWSKGFGEGWDAFKTDYKYGDTVRSIARGELPIDRTFKNPIADKTVGLTWRASVAMRKALVGSDAIFREPAKNLQRRYLSLEIAKKQYTIEGRIPEDAALRSTYNFMRKSYEKTGFTPSIGEIADSLEISMSKAKAQVKQLEEKSFIKQVRDQNVKDLAERIYQDIDSFEQSRPPEPAIKKEGATDTPKTRNADSEGASALEKVRELEMRLKANQALADAGNEAAKLSITQIENQLAEAQVNAVVALRASDVDWFGGRATYNQTPGGVLGAISEGIGRAQQGAPVLRFVQPFSRVVANVLNAGLDWTPIGFARAIGDGRGGGMLGSNPVVNPARGRFTEAQKAAEIRRAAIGTAALTTLVVLDANGTIQVTGSGPNDVNKRKELEGTNGWAPNSIILGNGKYKINYTAFGDMGLPFSIVGNYLDGLKYNGVSDEDAEARLGLVISSSFKSIVSQSFLKNIGNLLDAVQNYEKGGEQYLKNFTASTATSVVPNMIKQVGRLFDPTAYQTSTIWSAMKAQLPFAAYLTDQKPALNVWGEPLPRSNISSVLRFVPGWKDPIKVRQYINDKDIHITVPAKTTKVPTKKGKRQMTEDEYYDYLKASGNGITKALEANKKTIYSIKDQEALKDFVSGIVDAERKKALAIIARKVYSK